MTCQFDCTKIKYPNDILYLNIGGKYYDTFYGTLATGESLFFHQIFRHSYKNNVILVNEKKIIIDNDGRLFIDRNGELFKYILDYFRTGKINTIPEDYNMLKELYKEAVFYQIYELASHVSYAIKNYPKYEPYDVISYPYLICPCKNCHTEKYVYKAKNGLKNERYDQLSTLKIKNNY
ncbi:BTB/POZ-like domain and Potassium channel tetramerisation-type BTB domain and BTB/POZ fold domain-containing protein [Strongyloides ratti]|uniref:BTB/POZ-like domain and Potassium channel tetramerisation-type BTB domain and BTB/POZ fold domain-containing protein n=1 Tax=Strongyloides ratti TaxID=34506 RepID=A0A090LNR7_STRRB|nr:BTB/POZ-like domain and Potassium channel tetramerisation-type BTB domain and BTB/POZ fold domain-containing protein [Strongyloides ratti]CEF69165.1 BTB/POZ-like domain and Potassium channel tetramerisation-type BTB domain and BTB/POZ fold domain-containing protein [Strongyloides ratti]